MGCVPVGFGRYPQLTSSQVHIVNVPTTPFATLVRIPPENVLALVHISRSHLLSGYQLDVSPTLITPPPTFTILSYHLLTPNISYCSFSSTSTPTIRLVTAFSPSIFSYLFNQWLARYYLAGTHIQRNYRYSTAARTLRACFPSNWLRNKKLGCTFPEHVGINVGLTLERFFTSSTAGFQDRS